MIGLIGSSGFIGQHLSNIVNFDFVYNSTNIEQILQHNFDCVYCAAPSSNRLIANKNSTDDLKNIQNLINILKQSKIKKFVLIGTIDTLHSSDLAYGKNRKVLENFVKEFYTDHHIIRLCLLIDKHIKKNILFDLKNSLYLQSINLDLKSHWYPLGRLPSDIDTIIKNDINEINLVSTPIANRDIVTTFFPQLIEQIPPGTPTSSYDEYCNRADIFGSSTNYLLTQDQIFKHIAEYLK